jgi:hypothetical protein
MTIAAIAFTNTGPIESPGTALVPDNSRRVDAKERAARRAVAFFGVGPSGAVKKRTDDRARSRRRG